MTIQKWFLVAPSGKPFDAIGWKTKFESFYIFQKINFVGERMF